MWIKRHLFLLGALILFGVMAVQMLYPYETALPFARSLGQPVGFEKHNEIAANLQTAFEQTSIELDSGDRTAITTLPKLGAELNADRMTSALTDYPLWQRLIPFSILAKWPVVSTLDISLSGPKLLQTSNELATQLSYPATDASFSLKGGKLTTITAHEGKTVSDEAVRAALVSTRYAALKTKVDIKGTVAKPVRNDEGIETARSEAEAALAREVYINVAGKGVFTPDAATKASWLVIKNTPTSAELSTDSEAILRYVAEVNGKVKTDPTATVINLVDGNEASRQDGKAGAALDSTSIGTSLAEALTGKRAPAVAATLQSVAPETKYNRSYSHTQDGLRAYVAYATSTQNVRIVVQQLDGQGWSASGRASESIPSASTYKLYVMMRVFDDINSGKLSWDTPMLDTNAGGCFERTIVPSTNPCAEEWIRQYGRNELNDYVHGKGFSSGTGFTFSDATHTTAGDLAKYLIGLNNGTLVNGNNRAMLLDKMSRQLYRYGIPTGVSATRVEDKVGFLWDYIHDAAIVHKPQGTYVLVIMTKGYSYGYIANVARQIDTIMYP